jgi:membrane-bound serine protease (ClpP class)
MDGPAILFLLYAAGALLLAAELFIPSSGVLTVVSLLTLAVAVVMTFRYGTAAGLTAAGTCAVLVPASILLAIKNIHRLPMGKYMAPPNPPPRDRSADVHDPELEAWIGKRGRALTPLRPIGDCEIDGRRMYCVAESGMIDKETPIQVCGLNGKDLIVRVAPAESA